MKFKLPKIDKEMKIYILIAIILYIFIMFLPDIHSFIGNLKRT